MQCTIVCPILTSMFGLLNSHGLTLVLFQIKHGSVFHGYGGLSRTVRCGSHRISSSAELP